MLDDEEAITVIAWVTNVSGSVKGVSHEFEIGGSDT